MAERQLGFTINNKNEFELCDPSWGLPPRPLKWPTAEELLEAAKNEPEPREVLRQRQGRYFFLRRPLPRIKAS